MAGGMVPAWDPQAKQLFEVPEDRAEEFAKQGFTLGDDATTLAHREGWQGSVATLGLGALHGLTLGGSDFANGYLAKHMHGLLHAGGFSEADLASPERFNRSLDELKGQHWAANIGGEIAGGALPFLATGGLAEGAVAARGALALGRGVRTAEEMAQAVKLAKLAQVAGIGARVATAGASGGIQAYADSDRFDTPLSGEQVLQSIGLGGIYGGIGEGVGVLLPKMVTGTQRFVKRALDKASMDETAFTGVKGTEIGFEQRHPGTDKLVQDVYTAQLPDVKAMQDIRMARKYAKYSEPDAKIDTHDQALEFLEGKGKRDAAAGLRKFHAGKYEFNQPIKSGEFAGVHTLDEIADYVKRSSIARTEAQAAADVAMRADLSGRLGLAPEDLDAHITKLAEGLSNHHRAVQAAIEEQNGTKEFAQGVKDHLDATFPERNAEHKAVAGEAVRRNYIDELGKIAQQDADERAMFKAPRPGLPGPEAPTLDEVPPLYEPKPFAGEAPTEPARPVRRPYEYATPPPEAGVPPGPELQAPPVEAPPAAEPAVEAGAEAPPAAEAPPQAEAPAQEAAAAEAPAPETQGPGGPVPLPPEVNPVAATKQRIEVAIDNGVELNAAQIRELMAEAKKLEVQQKVGPAEKKIRRLTEKKFNKPNAKMGRKFVEEAMKAGTALEAGSPEAIEALKADTHQEMFIRHYNKKFVIPKLPEDLRLIRQGSTKEIPNDAKMIIKGGKFTARARIVTDDLDGIAGKAEAPPTVEAPPTPVEAPPVEAPAEAPVAEAPAEAATPAKEKVSHKKGQGKKAKAAAEKAAAEAEEEANAKRAAEESDRAAEAERAAEEAADAEKEAAKAKAIADKAAEKAAKQKARMEKAAAQAKRAQTREANTVDQQKYRDAKREYDDAMREHIKAKRTHEEAERNSVRASEIQAKNVERNNAEKMREHAKANAAHNAEMAAKLKEHQDRLSEHDKNTIRSMRAVRPEKVSNLEDAPLTEINRMATEGQGPLYGLPHVEHLEDLGPHLSDFLEHVENHPDMPASFRPREFNPANFQEYIAPQQLPDREMPFMRSHGEYTMRRPHFVTAGIKAHYASLMPYVGPALAAAYTVKASKHILGRYALNAAFKNEQAIMNLTKGITGAGGKWANKAIRTAFEAKAGDLGSRAYRARLDNLDTQYAEATQGIQHLNANPQLASEGVTKVLAPIAKGQEALVGNTATAAGAAISHLASLIPAPTPGGALDDPTKGIPRSEKVNFMRAYEAVNDPASALAHPTAGSVASVEAAHPATMAEIRSAIMKDLTDPKIAARVRRNPELARRLSTILGHPLRRADTPAAILSAQKVAQSQGLTPPPPGAPGMAKPQQSGTVNLTGPAAKNFVQSVATPQQADQLDNLGD